MNNARIWLVVNPTVGIPLFLGAVAVTSLIVHAAIIKDTTWFADFHEGKPINGAKTAALQVPEANGSSAVVVFKGTASASAQDAVVVLPDGRTARVVFDAPAATTTALADTK